MLLLKAAEPSLIDINFGLMFWTLVTFVIVLIVLKKKAFGPIQDAIDARRKANPRIAFYLTRAAKEKWLRT